MNLSNKKRKKAATAGAVLLALMLTVSACGVNVNNKEGNGDQNNASTAAPTDNLPEENGVLEPGAPSNEDQPSNNEDGGSEQPDSDLISAEGVYTGQIDSNSIEITTASGAAAYQFHEDMTSVIEKLPDNAKIKFKYTEKVVDSGTDLKQLWLTEIEVVQ